MLWSLDVKKLATEQEQQSFSPEDWRIKSNMIICVFSSDEREKIDLISLIIFWEFFFFNFFMKIIQRVTCHILLRFYWFKLLGLTHNPVFSSSSQSNVNKRDRQLLITILFVLHEIFIQFQEKEPQTIIRSREI